MSAAGLDNELRNDVDALHEALKQVSLSLTIWPAFESTATQSLTSTHLSGKKFKLGSDRMVLRKTRSRNMESEKQLARSSDTLTRIEQELQSGLDSMLASKFKHEVDAYVLLALHPGNLVSSVASHSLKDSVQPHMREWGSNYLRMAHEGVAQEIENDEANMMAQYTTLNDGVMFQNSTPQTIQGEPSDNYLSRAHHSGSTLMLPPGQGFNKDEWAVNVAFQIDDEESVVKTLMTCLYFLQQVTIKKISKAWVKGICPRKQSRFPYRDKKSESEGKKRALPGWWPSKEMCRFKEPDHINRNQRMNLCLHLLRLRPSTQQLRELNGEDPEAKQPGKTHQEGAWVAFLKELAPLSVVEEVGSQQPENLKRRQQVLKKMYEVAELEEAYMDDAIDGNTILQPLDPELARTIVRTAGKKRSRQCSVATSNDTDDTVFDTDDDVAPKKAKTIVAGSGLPVKPTPKGRKTKPAAGAKQKRRTKAIKATPASTHVETGEPDIKPWLYRTDSHAVPQPASGPFNTSSFSSAMSDVSSDAGLAWPPYVPPYHENNMQVHRVNEVPQPQFVDMRFDGHHLNLGPEMAALSMDTPISHGQPMEQVMPALPASTQQYKHWPELNPQLYSYEVQHGLPSSKVQHAGFAVGFDGSQTGPGWATHYHQHVPIHGDNDMQYQNMMYGPSHELPPAALPASVERGFTGHASGVGDSACPPGSSFRGYTMERPHD